MNGRRWRIFLKKVQNRIGILRGIIAQKEQQLSSAPEGTLHISEFNSRIQYYAKRNGKRNYIRESDRQLAKQLCQKDYDKKVLRSAREELKQLEKLCAFYSEQDAVFEGIYERMDARRRIFIEPVWLSDEEYIKRWNAVGYERKGFREDAPELFTEKGERVRSKTELLIANALNKYNIPYRYEYPLMLKGYGLIHPDFTVLNVRKRKEIYFEHMGMMDDEEYREEAFRRILAYEKNGFFPGDKLVLTHETLKNPVNSRVLEMIIEEYFL